MAVVVVVVVVVVVAVVVVVVVFCFLTTEMREVAEWLPAGLVAVQEYRPESESRTRRTKSTDLVLQQRKG